MSGVGILYSIVALAAGPRTVEQKSSADVVVVNLSRHSIADGLESYFVEITVASGWHVYANVEGDTSTRGRPKPHPDAAAVVEFLANGRQTTLCGVHYPKGVVKKVEGGGEYRAYEGTVSMTAWLIWDDVKDATVTVRVRVVATDGKTRLKEAVVSNR